MDDTAVGIISPAATYPSVPALGFFVDGTKCDSLATNQRGGTARVIPKRRGPVDVAVNDVSIGGTGELPKSGVMHCDGIRGVELWRDLKFDASMLKKGENVIDLTKNARSPMTHPLQISLALVVMSTSVYRGDLRAPIPLTVDRFWRG